uniref:PHP domain-containing protein n=2 Tax=Enterocloster clostridioformis TaxID=1531 RepID=UPI0026ECBB5F
GTLRGVEGEVKISPIRLSQEITCMIQAIKNNKEQKIMEYKTADYHVHSTISPDAKGTMEEMCNAAMDAGIEEVAFTDHYEFYAGGITGKYFNRECPDLDALSSTGSLGEL